MIEIRRQGYDAQKAGTKIEDNPYKKFGAVDGIWYTRIQKSSMADQWEAGWNKAFKGESLDLFGNNQIKIQ